jgi:hypothetical protein
MKRTKADKKAEEEKYSSNKIGGDDYPYGLSVHLDHHSLKKLGLHGALPKVGSKIPMTAHAHVKSTREENRDGKMHRSMELELRHMSMEHGEGKNQEKPDGDTEEMNKGMKKALDKAVIGPKEGGSADIEDGDEA